MEKLAEIIVIILLMIVAIVVTFNIIEYGTEFVIFIIDSMEKIK